MSFRFFRVGSRAIDLDPNSSRARATPREKSEKVIRGQIDARKWSENVIGKPEQPRPQIEAVRTCLRCRVEFTSTSCGHRICPPCRAQNANQAGVTTAKHGSRRKPKASDGGGD